MKEEYVMPVCEIVEFETEDVITASDGPGLGEGGGEDSMR